MTSIIKRIYLSRQYCKRRRIINEKDLLPLLAEFEIEVISPEIYSISEQAKIFSDVIL
ncbi:glycosyltransferase 61 family protein [Methylacidiphilum kamchatkense]|uniref:glycosyltransferase 61 family protein n=1 Tax=Methylacidiphilum kamchatkense TaxID=431057 RepID=UPI0009A205C0